MVGSSDKAVRKHAKERAREVNAHLKQLRGAFEVGVGVGGLTVFALPG